MFYYLDKSKSSLKFKDRQKEPMSPLQSKVKGGHKNIQESKKEIALYQGKAQGLHKSIPAGEEWSLEISSSGISVVELKKENVSKVLKL